MKGVMGFLKSTNLFEQGCLNAPEIAYPGFQWGKPGRSFFGLGAL
jgi:hypothetical protein